jgi:hypothetical protein
MIEQDLVECLEKNYKVRKQRLADALRGGARRTDRPLQFDGEKCTICNQPEHGGGLLIYQLQNGDNLPVGHRCAEYLEYLRNNSAYARNYAR